MGVVIAVDANPYCIDRIQESKKVGHYSQLEIIPVAIGDCNGDIQFNLADDPMYSSLADLSCLDFTSTDSRITVPLRKLDDILLESKIAGRKIRLVKIDVEGAELDLIRGAENSINAKALDYLYVEVHEKKMRLKGQDPEELFALIAARGFSKVKHLAGGENTFFYQSYE